MGSAINRTTHEGVGAQRDDKSPYGGFYRVGFKNYLLPVGRILTDDLRSSWGGLAICGFSRNYQVMM